jgi:hypothetical protein
MPPHTFPPGPPSGAPVVPGPRQRTVPMWFVIGGVALVAAVVVVAVVVVAVVAREPSREEAGGPDFQKLLRAPVQPMPALGPELGTVPSECGVSPATLERVVPKRDDDRNSSAGPSGYCDWSSFHDDESVALSVNIRITDDTTTGPAGSLNHEVEGLTKETPLQVVARLGDEAYAHYLDEDRSGYATIVMRAGNSVTKVVYSGFRGRQHDEALPESQLMPSALQVAQDVAQGLGVPATGKPAITDIPEDQPAVSARKGACAAVSGQTRQRLLNRQSLGPQQLGSVDFMFAPAHDGPQIDNCYWYGKAAKLTVETMTLADPPEGAAAQADRTLDWLHRKIRKEGVSGSTDGGATVLALTGRGDGALAAYEPSSSLDRDQGLVAFRIHNAVIKVTYEAGLDQELTQEQAINGAYTAAVEVAATFTP